MSSAEEIRVEVISLGRFGIGLVGVRSEVGGDGLVEVVFPCFL